jgi:DNA-binding beta-propeller fold protein YncE
MRIHASSMTLLCAAVLLACSDDSGRPAGDEGVGSIGFDAGTLGDSGESDESASGGIKYDQGTDDLPGDGNPCDGNGVEVEFSYIWIANSAQNTVSKIDTKTMTELGRYVVSPGANSQGPSRTSVNLDGDVAVVDRDGGVTKILADSDSCDPDLNGMPGLQTSTGADDLRAWGDDDCVAWHTPLPVDARPAAWTIGQPLTDCAFAPPSLWVSAPKADDSGAATVYLLHGNTGEVQAELEIAAAHCNCPVFGLYGGAVDDDNDLWAFPRDGDPHGSGPLIHVDFQSLTYEVIPQPAGARAYGITVDAQGRTWLAGEQSVQVYDPASLQWTQIGLGILPGSEFVLRGLSQDDEGDVWIAAMSGWGLPAGVSSGILRIDSQTLQPIQFVGNDILAGLVRPTGTSIDVDGGVWLVDSDGNQAFRYDPLLNSVQVIGGLQVPYTYSDMTGHGLKNVGFPPQG